jgi:signal transduction histidine kinase
MLTSPPSGTGPSRLSARTLAARFVRFSGLDLSPRARVAVMTGLVLCVALIGVADYLTGPLLSMEFFYLVPVSVGTLIADARFGIALAVQAAAVSLVADLVFLPHEQHPWFASANTALMVVTLAITVWLIATLKDHARAAEQSEQRSRDFLADAAHQLRNPIAGILASTEALVMGESGPTQETLLTNLGREAHHTGRLFSSLIRIARLDQAEPLPVRPADVVALCQIEIDRISSLAPHLRCQMSVADALQRRVWLNPDATREAVGNLIDNARRHADSCVALHVGVAGERLRLAVTDDGPGLPPGKVGAAFERFVSLDGFGGTGLGLPIARAIAEACGGSLVYMDKQFVLTFPYLPVSPALTNSTAEGE